MNGMKTKTHNLSRTTKSNIITYGIVVAAYIIVEIFLRAGMVSSLLEGLLVPLCMYVILAVSLNLTVGISGELSLGHAGFMCVGAFSSAFFSRCMEEVLPAAGIRFTLAILIGTVFAALFGILIGVPVLRLKGDYLAIVTLAFGEIIKNVVNVIYLGRDSRGFHISTKDSISLGLEQGGDVIIKGPQGITGTPNDSTFLIGVVLILITLFIVINLINSRTGRAIMAIRDNRIAAESIGINVTKYKLLAFSVSAALAGTAGVLYAHNLSTLQAQPKNFRIQHVHYDSCICSSGRHRKHSGLYDCGCGSHPSSGAVKRVERLPYADLRGNPDCYDDLYLQSGRTGDSGTD